MKHTPVISAWVIAGAIGLAAGITLPASTADAVTVSFFNVSDGTLAGSSTHRFDVGCFSDSGLTTGAACSGALLDVSLNNFDTTSPFLGDLTDGQLNENEELAFVQNYVQDPTLDWTGGSVNKTELDDTDPAIDTEDFQFMTIAEYVLFTIGTDPRIGLLRNDSGGKLWIDFDAIGQGAGLSHYSQFGVIPIPATLPLFLTGLLGLGFLARRRRQAMEA